MIKWEVEAVALAAPVSDRLIILTRYPQLGQAKTRLIPALGQAGAAEQHRQMVEHTLNQARQLRQQMPLTIEVWFTGATTAEMQAWLGDDLSYHPQQGDDLGDRLSYAVAMAFQSGCQRVVMLGTDCPFVDSVLLRQAFLRLAQQDVVLGPAMDGGYYLIGLRQPFLFLFEGIAWSTAQVLEQTCAIARAHGLRFYRLPWLSDIDYPKDLPIWAAATATLSVIIPVLNEAASLEHTLAAVQTGSYLEVIVVDGGSQDQTVAIAQKWGAQVITTTPGRGHQMNVGATAARGDLLLFLHGDTRLPLGFDALARRILAQTGVVGAAFMLKIEGQSPCLRLVEWGVKWRSRLFQLPYGDQAIFLKAATFKQIGGFAELPIMEDFVFIQALRRLGRVAIAPAAVLTSGRRWQKLGVLKVTLLNQLMIVGYRLGVSPVRLARWYRTWR